VGGNYAVHGGVLPLLFDSVFGMVIHAAGRPISRTAFLHVDYRKVTPIDTPLTARGWVRESEVERRLSTRNCATLNRTARRSERADDPTAAWPAMTSPALRRLSTPRAAAVAGVLFALLFGTVLILVRTTLPEHAEYGTQWADSGRDKLKLAAVLMPFAASPFCGSSVSCATASAALRTSFHIGFPGQRLALPCDDVFGDGGRRRVSSSHAFTQDAAAHAEVVAFGQILLLTLTKTYAFGWRRSL